MSNRKSAPLTHGASTRNYDIVVVGAGISGINAAYRIQTTLPNSSFTIVENRGDLGGTWDLFKYPGIRSDSDLHTFGFPFNPWDKPNPIATGESIVEYMHETVRKFGIDEKIEFHHKVLTADWSSEQQHWRLDIDNNGQKKTYYANFVIMGTGYYNYETPMDAQIPGLKDFKGTTVHPQFWPQDLDYKGKKMVIIGSGATAITILPAVVDGGVGSVTMLQRSPSYILSTPQKKPGDKDWYDYFPRWLALKLVRLQFIVVPFLLFWFCRSFPNASRKMLRKEAIAHMPKDYAIDPHFKPLYNPWDQRLLFCPDADFFKAFKTGRAKIATDTIKRVTSDGIELSSGEKLDADIIVTATGLNIRIAGSVALSVDKKPVDISSAYLWRFSMLTGVPNLGLIVGYVNASWTLGSDSTSRLLTRLIAYMSSNKYTSATAQITPEESKNPQSPLGLDSGYVKNGRKSMPSCGNSGPWLPRNNYFMDSWNANRADLRKGMVFNSVST